MNKANECTCPSGDGSLVHPCPAHPAVEQACWDERKLSDLGNELHNLSCSIVHENEKLAEQIGGIARELWNWPQARAALAQPSPVRSSLLINGYQLRDALEFIAPDGTAEQLESEARIEWRQQDADFLEAGLYAWCAEYPEEGCVLLDDEPATAQPSPASDLDPLNLAPHAEAFNEAPAEALKPEQAEAERPEVVATMYTHHDDVDFREFVVVGNCDKGCEGFYGPEKLMTVAQHERIVGALRFERQQMDRAFTACINERDAALANVDALAVQVLKLGGTISFAHYPAAQAGQVPEVSGIGRDTGHPRAVVLYLHKEPTDDDLRAIQDGLRSLAAAPQPAGGE